MTDRDESKETQETQAAIRLAAGTLRCVFRSFAEARMLNAMPRRGDIQIGRKHVATLMCKIGITALYRK